MLSPSSTPARRPSDRLAVVEWVHGTANLQETDWLEWKSGYDLSRASGRVATAKHILGFANRMPDLAARHAGGCAYLLLGVEPGTCHGVQVHDSADIENWLRPYLGERVVYDVDYVAFEQRSVLFVVVEPPQWGDDIHPLRKEGVDDDNAKTIPRGRIFVRKNGKTEPATDTDVDRLTERARRQGTTLSLSLEAAAPLPALPAECFEDDFRDEYLAARERELLAGLPRRSDPFLGALPPIGETRSPRRFVAEVEQFVTRARARWAELAIVKAVEQDRPTLGFALVNPTDDNFEAVAVELTLPLPPLLVLNGVDELRERLAPPEPPARWGAHMPLLPRIRPVALHLLGPTIEPAGEEATLVRFEPVHVRPRSRHPLSELIVAARPALAGSTLTATWRATSRSTRGEITGTVDVVVAAAPATAATSS